MNVTGCPTREVLLAYHTGGLSESVADGVIAHISSCPACQATVKTFGEAEDSLIARLRRPPVSESYTEEPQCRELIQRAKAMVPTGSVGKHSPGHPSREQLVAYTRGQLAEAAAGVVAKHVDQCSSCESTLSNMASEAGTTVGKPERQQADRPSGKAGPRPQEMPPTELFGSSALSCEVIR